MVSKKVYAAVVIIIAVILGILACTVSPDRPDHMEAIFVISKFFEVMLPVLAVGALIKYICCCHQHGNDHHH